MAFKIPVTITTKQISLLNGFSLATARREVRMIKLEHSEAGKRIPRRITIEMYAEWSGISEQKIVEFLRN